MIYRYIGLNAATGQPLSDHDHIRQSIGKILTTPIGSRVMRRDFGSLLPELIDKPLNGANRMRVLAASVMAIARWEPRVELSRIALQASADGQLVLDLDLARRDGADSSIVNLPVPLRG